MLSSQVCLDLCPINKSCDECFQNPIKEWLFAGPLSPVTEVCSFVPMLFHCIHIPNFTFFFLHGKILVRTMVLEDLCLLPGSL